MSGKKIYSERFIAEDEFGEVLGGADTYEEALSLGGVKVIDTMEELQNSREQIMYGDMEFGADVVRRLMSGKIDEDGALDAIMNEKDCNVGYAKRLLASWIEDYKPHLLKSGVEDEAADLDKPFDIDGNFESWFREYVPNEGSCPTQGGEILRAANRILYRWWNDGEKIGQGYGNETVNPAARYIVDKIDSKETREIEDILNGSLEMDDNEYEDWINRFRKNIEDILRENEQLFHTPNDEDFWDWEEEGDVDERIEECYIEDDGNEYWFAKDGEGWKCSTIVCNKSAHKEGSEFGDETADKFGLDKFAEWGTFADRGYEYSWEALDEGDDEGHHEWLVTDVAPEEKLCEVGDWADPTEFNSTIYGPNGKEISEGELLVQTFIRSVNILTYGKYGIQVNKGFKSGPQAEVRDDWVLIDKNGEPNQIDPAEFDSKKDAERSKLYENAKLRYADVRVVSYRDVNR